MQGIAGRAVVAVAWASSMIGALAPRPSYASPLNKTVDFTYTICVPSVGQCNPPVHIHNYISSSGHVFAYHNAAGGKENTLGSSFSNGNAVGRFTVAGDSLVLDAATAQGNMAMTLRVFVTMLGSSCSLSGAATLNGQPMPIQVRSGPCRVYEGHKDY